MTPTGGADEVSALSASAYILLPEAATDAVVRNRPAAVPPPRLTPTASAPSPSPPVSIPNAGNDGFIGPLSIQAPASFADCRSGPCSLLQTRARVDSIVFFLQHQANHGLVRLADAECRRRTAARIARSGEAVRLPIARTAASSSKLSETFEWELAPDLDTYYAVVATDARVARKIANHMDRLPLRCSDSLRQGLEDKQLQDWLEELAAVTANHARHVDWRAVEVRNVL